MLIKKIFTVVMIACVILNTFIAGVSNGYNTTQKSQLKKKNYNFGYLQEESIELGSIKSNVFIKNCGQLENDEIRFYIQDGKVWFTDDGVWFEIREELSINSQQSTVDCLQSRLMTDDWRPMTREYKRIILKQQFVGANLVRPIGREKLNWNSNFFYGNDSTKWCTNVPNYAEVWFENIYDSIDLRYYSNENGMKYDFIVYPGANIENIRLRYEGAEELGLDSNGNIEIKTELMNILDSELYIYQESGDSQQKIEGNFKLFDTLEYGFEISEEYNYNNLLVIDPKLEFSTYFGGSSHDYGCDIDLDSFGNPIIVGYTFSPNFPIKPGANDTNWSGGYDAFVSKLDSSGSNLLYSTYIGGSDNDEGYAIAVDSNGNAFITGGTQSSDFPTTPNVYKSTKTTSSFAYEVFVLQLNQTGSELIYSTYIGGNAKGKAIGLDSARNAFVTGETSSPGFPTTAGAYDESFNNIEDIFIFKINQSGSKLFYSTFVGGTNFEKAFDIKSDLSGNAYVTGITASTGFPTTPGALNRTHNGDTLDIFLLKLNQTGRSLNFSTFIGGSKQDWALGLELDINDHPIITGRTTSVDFPTTKGVVNESYNGRGSHGYGDCYILKLNHNASKLNFSTYLGGSDDEIGYDIVLDTFGNIIISGITYSTDFPITGDAYDSTQNGNMDIFISKLTSNASCVLYSTYFGGSNTDELFSSKLSEMNDIFITGNTYSNDFPNTTGVINNSNNGMRDAFLTKFSFEPIFNISSVLLLKDNEPTTIVYPKFGPYNFKLEIFNSVSLTDFKTVQLNLDPGGTNIQLIWDRVTGEFQELSDPHNHIFIHSSSYIYHSLYDWEINFNVTFNWSYPDENLNDIQVYATSTLLPPAWFNATGIYRLENDLVFNGTLVVKGEDNRYINNYSLIRGGEILAWSGLNVVYEGTTDQYPPDEEFNITIWDENNNFWTCSTGAGEAFEIETIPPMVMNNVGFSYKINISEVPSECDATNESFIIMIDGDNVTFSEPTPSNSIWQTTSNVQIGITITDNGGGFVNGTNIMQSVSTNNGTTWSTWGPVAEVDSQKIVTVQNTVLLEEGKNNLIKWSATDSVGNGPTESEPYRIIVDTKEIKFSNGWPLPNLVSSTNEVNVGITISDATSGVDASTVEYSISEDMGSTWRIWKKIEGLQNGNEININMNLTFKNGTANWLKWRASDIAGNGPKESEIIIVKVNNWTVPVKPKATLLSPPKGLTMNKTTVLLTWELENTGLKGVVYDLYFDNKTPPGIRERNIISMNFEVNDLQSGETYYWRVIPKLNGTEGSSDSGIWWFKINLTTDETIYKLGIYSRDSVSLFPGENESIVLTISNLGTTEDRIKLELTLGELSNYFILDDYSMFSLSTNSNIKRTLFLTLPNTVLPGNYEISISAISINSGEIVKVKHKIFIEVKTPDINGNGDNGDKPNGTGTNASAQNPTKKSNDLLMYSVIIIVVIIIICLSLAAFFYKRKKQMDENLLPKESVTTKPQPLKVINIGEGPPAITPQVGLSITPSTTTQALQQDQAIAPSVPSIEKSSTIGQTPIQIPKIAEVPQLPPAPKVDISTEPALTQLDSSTSTPQPTLDTKPVLASQTITQPTTSTQPEIVTTPTSQDITNNQIAVPEPKLATPSITADQTNSKINSPNTHLSDSERETS